MPGETVKSLLPFLEYSLALPDKDKFEDGVLVNVALEEAFYALCKTLGYSEETNIPVFFSVDHIIPHVDGEDKFLKQIKLAKAYPPANVCHMRLVQNVGGAHWHGSFAQINHQGHLEKITFTDSRVIDGKGRTAHEDIKRYDYLREKGTSIKFQAGLQQPRKSLTCWQYALANLASLATGNGVYKRTTSESTLGQELHSLLTGERQEAVLESTSMPQSTVTKKKGKKKERTTETIPGPTYSTPAENSEKKTKNEKPAARLKKPAKASTQYSKKNHLFFEAPKATKPKPCSVSPAISGGLLLTLGAGMLGTGIGLIFVCSPLGISLSIIGGLLASIGLAILFSQCLTSHKNTEEREQSNSSKRACC